MLRETFYFLVAALVLLNGCENEEPGYPSRPISVLCPWAVGGGTDTCSRIFAAELERETGVPVNVINRIGGGGVTGHSAGARANPDGYTVLTITTEITMMHWRGLTDVSYRDYTPLCLFNRDAAALIVRGDAPWKNLKELRDHIESHPGELRASGTALGGIWHLGCIGALLAMDFSSDFVVWVPSHGAAPAMQELLSGGIHIVCCSLPEARSLLESGDAKALGVMAEERVAQFPDVPTLREQGVDWTLGGWRGFALPRSAPPEVAAKVREVVSRVAGGESFQEFLRTSGFGVSFEDADAFANTLERDDRTSGRLIEKSLKGPSDEDQKVPGPWFFPLVLASGLVLLGFGLASTTRGEELERGAPTRQGKGVFVAVLTAVILYVVLAQGLGFLVTAALILFLLSKTLGASVRASVILAVTVSPAIYLLFSKVLRVPLPEGIISW